ncbi:MAG: signal peptidase II, partial [bacterium]
IAVIFLVFIVGWFIMLRPKTWLSSLAFGLVAGGGLSNILDRVIFDGRVADYWQLNGLTTFNLADVFITIGLILILQNLFRHA